MRLLKAERGLFAMLGLLILVTSALAAGLPRLLDGQYDRSLRTWTRTAGTTSTDVWIRGVSENRQTSSALGNADRVKRVGDELRGQLPVHLDQVAGRVSYNVTTTGSFRFLFQGRKESAFVGYDPELPSHVRYVAGNPPSNTMPAFDPAQGILPTATLQVGLSATAAQDLGLKVGDVVHLHGAAVTSRAPTIVVSGLYQPLSLKDPFWQWRLSLGQTIEIGRPPDVEPAATMALDATGYEALFDLTDEEISYNWYIPIATSKITAATATPVVKDVSLYGTQVGNFPMQPSLRLDTALDKVLQGFTSELSATQAVLSLAIGGLGGVAIGVLLISIGVLLDRLRARLSVSRARGAGLWQLALSVGGTMAVWTLPAAVLGYVAGILLFDGRSSVLSVAGPVVVLLIAVVGPAFGAAVQHRRPLRETRSDVVTAKFGLRRLVLELLLVAVAVAGTITLRLHGLKGGSNPLLSVTPVLLGAALGLIVLRLYPYPLRALTALLGRGRSTVSFLGLAHAARQPARAALPALVLLLATAVAAFSGTVDSSIRHAQARAAWQTVGGDGEVTSTGIEKPQIDALRRLPGVTNVIPAQITQNVGIAGTTATLVAVDLDAYRKLVAGHPIALPAAPKPDGGSSLPALVSPDLKGQAGTHPTLAMTDGTSYPLHVTGTIGSFPTVAPGTPIVLVPYSSLGAQAFATTAFVAGRHLKSSTLASTGTSPGFEGTVNAQVESSTENAMTHAPLVGVVRDGFGYGALVISAYGFLAVLMALMIGAERRGRTVSYLRTLGLSGRQLGLLGLLELAPTVVTAVVAGWALGLLLPVLVGSALDLTPYTSGFPVENRPLDASTALLMIGGLVVATGLAVAIDSLVNSRRRLGGLLRIGDQ